MARWPTRARVSASVGMVSSVPASAHLAEVGGGVVGDPALAPGHPLQPVVVEHHRLAVGAQLHVELDAVAGLAGRLEGAQRVLRRAVRRPQPAVRDRPARTRRSQASPNRVLHRHLPTTRVDLDREIQRQAIDADRRAGMAASVAEHLDHQVRAAVEHLGDVEEAGPGLDEAAQLDDARDPREIAVAAPPSSGRSG